MRGRVWEPVPASLSGEGGCAAAAAAAAAAAHTLPLLPLPNIHYTPPSSSPRTHTRTHTRARTHIWRGPGRTPACLPLQSCSGRRRAGSVEARLAVLCSAKRTSTSKAIPRLGKAPTACSAQAPGHSRYTVTVDVPRYPGRYQGTYVLLKCAVESNGTQARVREASLPCFLFLFFFLSILNQTMARVATVSIPNQADDPIPRPNRAREQTRTTNGARKA